MEQRLIEIILPEGRGNDIPELLHELPLSGFWRDSVDDNQARIRILLQRRDVETVLDILEPYLEKLPSATALLLIVETSIPRQTNNKAQDITEEAEEKQEKKYGSNRISRHELYATIAASTEIVSTYIIMVLLSAIVASIGLIRNDMAIIIGAMVLAPLLTPNVALALAANLGDGDLAAKALKTSAVGFCLAFAVGALIGVVYGVNPETEAIKARTALHWSDILLALSSGAAGVLAFVCAGQLSLIGVMVAVALMPPLVTAGLLFGSGMSGMGLLALELTFTNVICVNLAGIITFSLQGIRPSTMWEKSKAKRAKYRSLTIWISLLLILALILGLEKSPW